MDATDPAGESPAEPELTNELEELLESSFGPLIDAADEDEARRFLAELAADLATAKALGRRDLLETIQETARGRAEELRIHGSVGFLNAVLGGVGLLVAFAAPERDMHAEGEPVPGQPGAPGEGGAA